MEEQRSGTDQDHPDVDFVGQSLPVMGVSKNRGFRTKVIACIIGSSVVFSILAVSLLSLSVRQTKQVSSEQRSRQQHLYDTILDWHVTSKETLDDSSSAQYQAWDWLSAESGTIDIDTLRGRYALATLYFSNKASWHQDEHWLSDHPVCLWHGVQCWETSQLPLVRSVNLTSNGLHGTIPPEIALLLDDVQGIDLSFNNIQGNLPDLSSLESLKELHLSDNDISGPIPASFYSLSSLEQLYIEDCKLSGSVAEEIGQLSLLRGLDLHNNYLSGSIPSSIDSMTDLKLLYLDANKLTGRIPTTIGALSQLVDVRLQHNRLEGPIPPQISNLRILQILYLNDNQLTGSIPGEALADLKLLDQLQLYNNNLDGVIPSELSKMVLLNVLYLDQNSLHGSIPENLASMEFLEQLYLYKNNLSGRIPTEFGSMKVLSDLRLQDNRLSGTIPKELVDMKSLEILYLQNNTLEGSVPPLPTSLERAELQDNELTGTVDCRGVAVLTELVSDCNEPTLTCECCTHCFP